MNVRGFANNLRGKLTRNKPQADDRGGDNRSAEQIAKDKQRKLQKERPKLINGRVK